MQSLDSSQGHEQAATRAVRLHYLDWLRVIATLGVFLFHATNVFNTFKFEIKNEEVSLTITIIDTFFYPWGMPLFFLLAGAGSWFALQRRSANQFTRERTFRLLVPFLTGTILLGPLQMFLSWSHRNQTGLFVGSFLDFVVDRVPTIGPKFFGAFGYHMWFLGFLFAFSLLALPVLVWLKNDNGRIFVAWLAGLCSHRAGILLFILPVAVIRMGLQPFFPELQDWADFFTYGMFFILGYLVFSDQRFLQAIRRDWKIILAVAIVGTLVGTSIGVSLESFDVEKAPDNIFEILIWLTIAVCGWCWSAFMLYIGMRYLDHDSKALRYGLGALLPFFVVHQPVVLALAYFIVQWNTSILIKLLVLVFSAFAFSLGLYEFVIKRIGFLRIMFGIKRI